MEKISCEICGGDICRVQGKYQCIKCGCIYSVQDLQEMLKQKNITESADSVIQPNAQQRTDNCHDAAETENRNNIPYSRKSRVWVIAAVITGILLVSLFQVWLNIHTGSGETTESEVRSVQEIIDSAAEETTEPERNTDTASVS